jgi:hypothetical protein
MIERSVTVLLAEWYSVMEVEMDRVCGTYEKKNACRVLVWKPEGNTT